jgi:hypothetical protein
MKSNSIAGTQATLALSDVCANYCNAFFTSALPLLRHHIFVALTTAAQHRPQLRATLSSTRFHQRFAAWLIPDTMSAAQLMECRAFLECISSMLLSSSIDPQTMLDSEEGIIPEASRASRNSFPMVSAWLTECRVKCASLPLPDLSACCYLQVREQPEAPSVNMQGPAVLHVCTHSLQLKEEILRLHTSYRGREAPYSSWPIVEGPYAVWEEITTHFASRYLRESRISTLPDDMLKEMLKCAVLHRMPLLSARYSLEVVSRLRLHNAIGCLDVGVLIGSTWLCGRTTKFLYQNLATLFADGSLATQSNSLRHHVQRVIEDFLL